MNVRASEYHWCGNSACHKCGKLEVPRASEQEKEDVSYSDLFEEDFAPAPTGTYKVQTKKKKKEKKKGKAEESDLDMGFGLFD